MTYLTSNSHCALIVLAYSYASRPLKHDVEGVLLVYYILLCQREESREYAAIISNIHATMCAKDCHCCTLSPPYSCLSGVT